MPNSVKSSLTRTSSRNVSALCSKKSSEANVTMATCATALAALRNFTTATQCCSSCSENASSSSAKSSSAFADSTRFIAQVVGQSVSSQSTMITALEESAVRLGEAFEDCALEVPSSDLKATPMNGVAGTSPSDLIPCFRSETPEQTDATLSAPDGGPSSMVHGEAPGEDEKPIETSSPTSLHLVDGDSDAMSSVLDDSRSERKEPSPIHGSLISGSVTASV
mmetsp:Transcript_15864/g.37466  ORF Transcript_15864/g.37466 Transcript_15864/m.37466 type:complete len:222 (+) Transcript_15864:364-1029(+)